MKLYSEKIIKRNIEVILFITMCLMTLVLIITNLKLIFSNQKPTLIAIDPNGTRIVKDATDPIFNTEATSFLKKFLTSTYNFTPQNFMQKVGHATSLMSEELWKSKKNQIISLKSKVDSDEITLTGEVEKLTKSDQSTYHALIKVSERSRMNTKDQTIETKIKLQPTTRTEDNPWGLEVSEYEETISK